MKTDFMFNANLWLTGQVTRGLTLGGGVQFMAARKLGDAVVLALQQSPLFVSASLPLRVFPPLFNRYRGGQSAASSSSRTPTAFTP